MSGNPIWNPEKRATLNRLIARRQEFQDVQAVPDEPAADESEHFYVCAHCGQAVDMRDLASVLYHQTDQHRPAARN
jgi:hypothetical protein